jgi:predicted secreted Zn-dependent protease
MMLPSTAARWGAALGLVLLCTLLGVGAVAGWPSPLRAAAGADRARGETVALAAAGSEGAGPGGALTVPDGAEIAVAAPPETPDGQGSAGTLTGVSVTASTRLYEVEGADVGSLLASLRQRGPQDGHETWAASTDWVFRWSYQPVVDSDCRVDTARVELDLTYTYPQWNAPASAMPALVTSWQRYLAQVELHERGHREIAEAAANDLVRALEALQAQPSCSELAGAARATADDLLSRHARAQIGYDRDTAHGATQGAVLSLER